MRLSQEKREFIKTKVASFRPNADVYLFGSRADVNKKGGDIDILVLDDKKLFLEEKLKIMAAFNQKFGFQKLDIVGYAYNDNDPFKMLAFENALAL